MGSKVSTEVSADKWPRRVPNLIIAPDEFERRRYAREVAFRSMRSRLDKAWRIFSWVSSILIAAVGGAMVVRIQPGRTISSLDALVVVVAILTLSTYACLWVRENLRLAANAARVLETHDAYLGVDTGYVPMAARFGYIPTIVLLALAALVAAILATGSVLLTADTATVTRIAN